MLRPTVGSGLVISWSGMRGIVSLAAALALPGTFPYRDLIVFTTFAVVLGTLVIQGLTLKPLLRALDLQDDDPVANELQLARDRAREAGLATLTNNDSPVANTVRQEFTAHLTRTGEGETNEPMRAEHGALHRNAVNAARDAILAMRASDEIGDDAFHQIEEELDWLEMADRKTDGTP
jgi:CPA1 family monovalent cation:H+ antiporter